MKLFKKTQPPEFTGRRRPQPGDMNTDRPSQAFSYYSQRSAGTGTRREPAGMQPNDRARDRTEPRSIHSGRRRLYLSTAAVFTACLTVYAVVLSNEPRIVLIQDRATAYFLQDARVYQQTASQTLGESLFNRNKITVDTSSVRLKLLKSYPEIQNVSVALPILGHQPQIYIEPYKPSFILTTTDSNAFLLDATGRALATTNTVPDIDKLGVPTLQDRSGITVKLGTRAVPSTTVSFAQTVVAALKQAQTTPASLVLPPAAYELDVYIAETPYFVKFNLQNDPLQQAGTYLATKKRLDADHVKAGQYIDVRVPERAYYK